MGKRDGEGERGGEIEQGNPRSRSTKGSSVLALLFTRNKLHQSEIVLLSDLQYSEKRAHPLSPTFFLAQMHAEFQPSVAVVRPHPLDVQVLPCSLAWIA